MKKMDEIITHFDTSKFYSETEIEYCKYDIGQYKKAIEGIRTIVNADGKTTYKFDDFYGLERAHGYLNENNIQVGEKNMNNILDALRNEIELLKIDYLCAIEAATKTLTNYEEALELRRQQLIQDEINKKINANKN